MHHPNSRRQVSLAAVDDGLRVELNENPMQDLILQGVTSHERLHNVGIAYHNEITRSQSAST